MNPLYAVRGWLRKAATRTAARTLQFFTKWERWSWPAATFRRLVEDGYRKHAIVFACVQAYADAFPEAPLTVMRRDDPDEDPVTDRAHPMMALMREPNPHMDEAELWEYLITYAAIGGLAGAWKERANSGDVRHLWPLNRGQITPLPATEASGWMEGYIYKDGDGGKAFIPAGDLIPIRWAIDPLAPLDGMSPLIAASRGVDTGAEAMRYVHSYLKNDATPGIALVTKNILPDNILDRMKAQFSERFGGENVGMPLILEGEEATIERVGANLKELEIAALHDVPDSWICAAYRVPAVLVGTNGGLQRGIQGAPREMQEFFFEASMMPRWGKVARAFQKHLLYDEYKADPDIYTCAFDTSHIRAFQEDQDATHARARADFAGGGLTLDEFRAEIGKGPLPGQTGEVRLSPASAVEIPLNASLLSPPAPEAVAEVETLLQEASRNGHERKAALSAAEATRRSVEARRVIESELERELDGVLGDVHADVLARVNGRGGE